MSNVFLDMAFDAGFTGEEAMKRARALEANAKSETLLEEDFEEEEEYEYSCREEMLENERMQYGDMLHDLQAEGEWPSSR